jgi:hypothetical protein
MAIKIIESFELKAGVPIDNRMVVSNLNNIPEWARFEGLITYQLLNKKYYKYVDGEFQPMTEALGVSSFNDRTGNVSILAGPNISINEIEGALGSFRIEATGVLLRDGSTELNEGYYPQNTRDIATKEYVDDVLAAHASVHAEQAVLGHVKLDNISIKESTHKQIYVDTVNGGEF